jgi:hypothetical protein
VDCKGIGAMEEGLDAMASTMVCRAQPTKLSLELLTAMCLSKRCPPGICVGAKTTHDLTWLIVGATDDMDQPWDTVSDVSVDLPVRSQAFPVMCLLSDSTTPSHLPQGCIICLIGADARCG